MEIKNIDLKKIEQNENSRVIYKETDLSELMHSMKKDGLLQPVGVKPLGNGKSITTLLWEQLEKNSELGVHRMAGPKLSGRVRQDMDRVMA